MCIMLGGILGYSLDHKWVACFSFSAHGAMMNLLKILNFMIGTFDEKKFRFKQIVFGPGGIHEYSMNLYWRREMNFINGKVLLCFDLEKRRESDVVWFEMQTETVSAMRGQSIDFYPIGWCKIDNEWMCWRLDKK